jgi:DNA-binding MarR family transcriptional regulator
MEPEYTVLNHLHENEITTQRRISKRTGLSLGAVNLLLKKMARKGLIKIEKLNARTMRYILTSQGIQEKSRLAYRYIRQSYRQILQINIDLDNLLAKQLEDQNGLKIVLFGPTDEIMEIITQYLNNKNISSKHFSSDNSLPHLVNGNRHLVLIWRQEEEEALYVHKKPVKVLKLL